jgi:Patatin-like phospholipase
MNELSGEGSKTSQEFSQVHREERARLGLSPDLKQMDGIGLALSGGGIRSASFALGVVQVLLNEGLLKRFDYLSTVSGGGYLGSALSWWLHRAATDDDCASGEFDSRFEAFRQQFGSKVIGSRTNIGKSRPSLWSASNWLAYIRQHGNYLQPRGVGYASLGASVLRVCLYPLCVYGIALVGLFCLVSALEEKTHLSHVIEYSGLLVALGPLAILVAISWAYGPATWFASLLGNRASTWLYRGRTRFRSWSGQLLSFIPAGLLVASIPAVYLWLYGHWSAWAASASSLSLGSIGAVYQFFQGRAQSKTPSWLGHVRLIVTSGLVIYGLLLGSYAVASYALTSPLVRTSAAETGLIALAFSAFFGLCVNSNYAGLARLYRDRLMEAFLPQIDSVALNEWKLATGANVQTVSDLAGHLTPGGELVAAPADGCQRPLHLVNCNAVLMDSTKDLYRNRGGDSFIITPLWSGSNATGWIKTPRLGDGAMTLATAMSISGAAANPNAAPNGLGVTRNRLVSFLMSLFNVRLGYWMANPKNPTREVSNRPNLWFPGFRQGLLGSGLSEDAGFVELTDGGHFDNTAIYELVRRRTKLIVVSQAGCDPAFTMEDLANAIEKVRVDFSVFIEFNDLGLSLDALRILTQESFQPCKRGFAIGRIRYPRGTPTSPEFDDGYLVYVQAVPAALPADIASYWRRHAEFPNDTTADQFFTEENLEAYRELGYAIAGEFHRQLKEHAQSWAATPGETDDEPAMTAIAKLLQP